MVKIIRFSSVSTGNWDTDWFKCCLCQDDTIGSLIPSADNGNNKITERRTILQRESQNS